MRKSRAFPQIERRSRKSIKRTVKSVVANATGIVFEPHRGLKPTAKFILSLRDIYLLDPGNITQSPTLRDGRVSAYLLQPADHNSQNLQKFAKLDGL